MRSPLEKVYLTITGALLTGSVLHDSATQQGLSSDEKISISGHKLKNKGRRKTLPVTFAATGTAAENTEDQGPFSNNLMLQQFTGIKPEMPSNSTRKKTSATLQQDSTKVAQRRRYNSPVRKQQTAETKERIISAGAELVHNLPAWDWTNITARAVGERAGISERTVHRYFPTERQLRDAVIQRMVQEAGVSLGELTLDGFANITQIMFSYLMSFAAKPLTAPVMDASLATMDKVRCDALRNAVAKATPGWSDHDRDNAAAVLDIFWNLPPYERLIQIWGFDAERAVGLITWLIDLTKETFKRGQKPNTNS